MARYLSSQALTLAGLKHRMQTREMTAITAVMMKGAFTLIMAMVIANIMGPRHWMTLAMGLM